jgi:hypothetical protein
MTGRYTAPLVVLSALVAAASLFEIAFADSPLATRAAIASPIIVVLGCAFVASFKVWNIEHQARLAAETKLRQLTDSYAYSLALAAIDFEETREHDFETKELKGRSGRFRFNLRNTIDTPVGYHFRHLKIDGAPQQFQTKGAVVSAKSEAAFFTGWFPLKAPMDVTTMWRLEIALSYGNPDRHTRLMEKSATITCYPTNDRTTFIYEKDEDVPLAEGA